MREIKRLRLRYADTCGCGVALAKGEQAGWDRAARQVFCLSCVGADTRPLATAGVPGASLAREYERRHASRERRVRTRFPRVGGLLLALFPESDSTKAFAIGAEGEQKVAAWLTRKCPEVLFLHNRRPGIGQRYGDIDHIAIAPSGIYVIDAKNYSNAKVRVAQPGIFSRAEPKLMIRGRNRTSLVDGLARQKESVDEALDGRVEPWPVLVMAMFCFLDADFPLFERLSIRGHLVRGQRGTARILNKPGPMTAEHRETLWNHLAGQLPSA